MKNEARIVAELPPLTEDTHEVCKHMRAASPPASAADLIEQQMPNRRNTRTRRVSGHECSQQLKFSVKWYIAILCCYRKHYMYLYLGVF